MILTMEQLSSLRNKLYRVRQEAIDSGHSRHACPEPHRASDGKPYRLEPKPKGRRHVLEKYGFEVQSHEGTLCVRIPLGVHGIDHLGVDPETGEVVCTLCEKGGA